MPNLWIIFLTGLITGGISCMAVQGGLLASIIATRQPKDHTWKKTLGIVIVFLIGKILAYTVLGFILGWVGSYFQMTVATRVTLMVVASLFMIVTALNLINAHPFFRFLVIQPPRFLYRLARNQTKNVDWFAPFVVGTLTIFLPCGTTQAMIVQALQFGNPILSASILFAFTVGTVPLFLLFGVLIQAASTVFTKYFAPVAAALVFGLAVWNLSNAAALAGLEGTVARAIRPLYCQIVYCEDLVGNVMTVVKDATTTPIITINATSYAIDNPYIKAGSEVKLLVKNVRGGGCIQFFTIPKLEIEQVIPVGKEETITFTAPQEKGDLPFMCSMGMYRGKFIVQ